MLEDSKHISIIYKHRILLATSFRDEIKNIIETLSYADPEQIYPDETTDEILKIFEKLIEELEKSNLPFTDNNLSVSEKQHIQYYRLALGDVKALLKNEILSLQS